MTTAAASAIVDDMRLPKSLPDPRQTADALAAVLGLRRMADDLEAKAVHSALRQGWSWSEIAEALGVSKQAAHRRLSHLQSK
ncbi:helix-turn-helix domain-containing protein [Ideonella sp. BN130291]|uniref:helix-turn-helix domain-containing protein n=1 Tax=Ideonella sp. BN130291 TaxID=3112940 RepID=UPI002E26A0E7|nr:helix-turn-helix domain-containing protein [Ideonella sp. BN130291]